MITDESLVCGSYKITVFENPDTKESQFVPKMSFAFNIPIVEFRYDSTEGNVYRESPYKSVNL